jgi:hypothetical protein
MTLQIRRIRRRYLPNAFSCASRCALKNSSGSSRMRSNGSVSGGLPDSAPETLQRRLTAGFWSTMRTTARAHDQAFRFNEVLTVGTVGTVFRCVVSSRRHIRIPYKDDAQQPGVRRVRAHRTGFCPAMIAVHVHFGPLPKTAFSHHPNAARKRLLRRWCDWTYLPLN